MDKIMCDNCMNFFNWDNDDWFEAEEDCEIEKVICPHCNKELSVSWYKIINYKTTKVEDII